MKSPDDFDKKQGCVPLTVNFSSKTERASLFEWDMGDGTKYQSEDVQHVYQQTGEYIVRLRTYKKCCYEEKTHTVSVAKCPNPFFAPNAFSPNNDGNNDEWKIVGTTIKEVSIVIYNRWGQRVYQGNSLQFGWDGKILGKPQPLGAYAFHANIEFIDGEKKELSGMINLVR